MLTSLIELILVFSQKVSSKISLLKQKVQKLLEINKIIQKEFLDKFLKPNNRLLVKSPSYSLRDEVKHIAL